MEDPVESQDLEQDALAENGFMPPSVQPAPILAGSTYSHYSPIPAVLADDMSIECVLGVDEAGRGPVIGPMVYAVFYLPLSQHHSLLADTHKFDDSKVLTATVRSSLMERLCTPDTDLHQTCGWATAVMSARDISAGMMRPFGAYNLNAQAMDTTIELIKTVLAKNINIKEIYIDTIGSPIVYQTKLEKIFPSVKITVAKKADSLYPCVSAASVCAKVTRDVALDASYQPYAAEKDASASPTPAWGSGYPSDARCSSWLKQNMDPLFGWGPECRFSWGTAKELLEMKNAPLKVDWPAEDEDVDDSMKMTDFFVSAGNEDNDADELSSWYGKKVTEEVF